MEEKTYSPEEIAKAVEIIKAVNHPRVESMTCDLPSAQGGYYRVGPMILEDGRLMIVTTSGQP